ncbi:hypothetical protein ASPFODRAFT_58991 [Aspergillus luchuensis CBS 106.47]|uniref:Uncharacterized protein n=2 Tax=Aspergillus subgen. Circumdati TaxID=2720871 RepID=A0A1M3TMW6_ASPLC|nr:hypothetical protein BO79DRAFT_206487 [Aspergillus costaricaensis CBS 115574]OJZ88157.1 hypothetical protein ASPFODRAFT_58991 [Aspergillus luchuensis CBS 106.47]RAK93515.1 hypothetical protein BO79DRAFT_206487 [Aspergillus costaricaensis CBS 115574]GLB06054.1 hypothetical protein AtubIFM57258_001350 [Aspergillus tubingensis]
MAVTAIDIMPKKPSSSPLSSNNPSMNKRLPPLADRTSLSYKLTTLSRQKLAREATAPDPDIRRCLGHFRLHCMSMEWTQKDMSTRINSFDLEDDESESEEEDRDDEDKKGPEDRKDEDQDRQSSSKNNESAEKTSEPEKTTVQVTFHVSAPASAPQTSTDKEEKEESLLEKGRNCLEKTVQRKNFWPSPGQCLPVRIAG